MERAGLGRPEPVTPELNAGAAAEGLATEEHALTRKVGRD